jgi:hypothetical protein
MLLDSASHKLISIVFACFVLFLAVTLNMNVSQANPLQEGPANKNSHEQFLQLFDYEIQNRAYALNTIRGQLEIIETNELRRFYNAYLALEQLNQQLYSPIAKTYQLEMSPRWWTRIRTQLGIWLAAMRSDISTLKFYHKIASNYLEQLQTLENQAPEESRQFFTYVFAQEQVQAESLGLAIEGQILAAAELLDSFVASHKSIGKHN